MTSSKYLTMIRKKVGRSRLIDTIWRNIVFGVFLGKVENLLGANEYIYILGVTQSWMTLEFCDARLGFSLNYVQKNTNQVWWWLAKIYSIPSPTLPYPPPHIHLSSLWYDWMHAIYKTGFILPITHRFSPFFLRRHVCERRTNLNEIFPEAFFEKNRFFATW